MCHFILDVNEIPQLRALASCPPIVWREDALHCAASLNWPLLIKRLIKLGLEKNTPAGSWDPPLHVASRKGSFLALEALLDGGADPNIITEDKETPLTYAVAENDDVMVELPSRMALM